MDPRGSGDRLEDDANEHAIGAPWDRQERGGFSYWNLLTFLLLLLKLFTLWDFYFWIVSFWIFSFWKFWSNHPARTLRPYGLCPHEESYAQLCIGDRVRCYSDDRARCYDGSVRWVHHEDDTNDAYGAQGGDIVGVELDMAEGKTDGANGGKRYFECEPFHAAFLARRMEKITGSDARRSPQGVPFGYIKAGRGQH